MSNVKISQLPEYTGGSPDLRWFIMNNSGETETYKYSGYSSQIIPGNGNESYITINLPRTHAPDDYMVIFGNHSGTSASAGANSAVLGGRNNRTTNQFGIVAGGLNNIAGYICGIFGGNGNNADGNTAMIVGGENNTCANVAWGGIFNGIQNYMAGGNDIGNGITGGYLNRMAINGVYGSNIIGGRENRWHQFDSRVEDTRFGYGAILGGLQNRIEGNSTDSVGAHAYPIIIGGKLNKIFGEESDDTGTTGATIINSYSSTIKDSLFSSIIGGFGSNILNGNKSTILAGNNNTIGGGSNNAIIGGEGNNNSGAYGFIGGGFNNNNSAYCGFVGGYGNTNTGDGAVVFGGSNNNGSTYSAILGGVVNSIAGGQRNGILGGLLNNITNSNLSGIIGGDNNGINGKDRAIMLGTSGRTADADNTTYVENIKVYRQIYGGIADLGTIGGTITIDWDLGNIQYFTLNATSSIPFFANPKEGATYILKIKQPAVGNHTLSWSVAIKWPNGAIPVLSTTSNAEDIITFVYMGGTLYGNIQKAFS